MSQPYREAAAVEKDEEEPVEKKEQEEPLPSPWPWVVLSVITIELALYYFFSESVGNGRVVVAALTFDVVAYSIIRGYRAKELADEIRSRREKAALIKANYAEERAKQEKRTRAICRGFVKAVKHPYVDIDAALITGNEEMAAEDVKVLSVFVRAEGGAT